MAALTIDGFVFYFDEISKFYASVLVRGWMHREGSSTFYRISSAKFMPEKKEKIFSRRQGWASRSEVNLEQAYLMAGANSFVVQGICQADSLCMPRYLRLEVEKSGVILIDLEAAAQACRQGGRLMRELFSKLHDGSRIVDLGGRARSGRLPYMEEPCVKDKADLSFVTFDIVDQDGVDIVGDAHQISQYIAKSSIDAVISISVFEHLLMPWKVVLEINSILKPGGYVFIHTHQTIGMHDSPWDYWRYSKDAWKSMFNRYTGFEIVDVEMTDPMHIVPFFYADRYKHAEKSAGFESSDVLARKIGETALSWDTKLEAVVSDQYPLVPDNNFR